MTTPDTDAKSGVVLVERIEQKSRELSHRSVLRLDVKLLLVSSKSYPRQL